MIYFLKRYLRRNWLLIINITLTPLFYLIINIFTDYLNVLPSNEVKILGTSVLFITYLIQSINVTLNFMLYAVNDLKQSVLYKRVGLTRIKSREFFLSYFLATFYFIIISYVLITIIFLVILSLIRQESAFYIIGNWNWLFLLVISLLITIFLIALSYYLSIILFNKIWLNMISGLSNIVLIVPLFILTIIFRTYLTYEIIFMVWPVWKAAVFVIGVVAIPIILSGVCIYFAHLQFKWER